MCTINFDFVKVWEITDISVLYVHFPNLSLSSTSLQNRRWALISRFLLSHLQSRQCETFQSLSPNAPQFQPRKVVGVSVLLSLAASLHAIHRHGVLLLRLLIREQLQFAFLALLNI